MDVCNDSVQRSALTINPSDHLRSFYSQRTSGTSPESLIMRSSSFLKLCSDCGVKLNRASCPHTPGCCRRLRNRCKKCIKIYLSIPGGAGVAVGLLGPFHMSPSMLLLDRTPKVQNMYILQEKTFGYHGYSSSPRAASVTFLA